MRWHRWSALLLLLTAAWTPPEGKADDKPHPDGYLDDRVLLISPTAAPIPALRYRLFPLASERKPGDAAPIYLRFAHERNDQVKRDLYDKPAGWLKVPLEELPKAEGRAFLDRFRYNLKQLELGARRQTCDWQYTLDTGDTIGLLLPDAQEMRMHMNLVAFEARLEIAEGHFEEAVRTLESGMAFSQHVAGGPFLINGLVGLAGVNLMSEQVADLVSQPGAPNLYWALTALPRPIVDLRRALEFEQRVLELDNPELADLDRSRTPAEWEALWERVRRGTARLEKLLADENPIRGGKPLTNPLSAEEEVKEGRTYLTDKVKLDPAAVRAMSPAQVQVLFLRWQYRELCDDHFKGAYLPYPQALATFVEPRRRLDTAPNTSAVRLARVLLPALAKVLLAQAKAERKIAALRVVEALRLHAAAHEGRLPERLDEVKAVPIPSDPVTGQAFVYHRDGRTATISSRDPSEPTPGGLRYRLTVR